jgi:hypothetical protein
MYKAEIEKQTCRGGSWNHGLEHAGELLVDLGVVTEDQGDDLAERLEAFLDRAPGVLVTKIGQPVWKEPDALSQLCILFFVFSSLSYAINPFFPA